MMMPLMWKMMITGTGKPKDNADYYLEDDTHIQNDDQGHSYDADTGEVIVKGGAGPGHE